MSEPTDGGPWKRPKKFTTQIGVLVTDEMRAWLEKRAGASRRSLAEYVRAVLDEHRCQVEDD